MRIQNLILPAVALGAAGALLLPIQHAVAWAPLGGNLSYEQRDFRVYDNFADATANDNQTPDEQFPGAQGAAMAIWKACVEWGNLHGDGSGDPHQVGGLGSGGSNFDTFFAGMTTNIGNADANIHSTISSCTGGTLAYCETPISNGWRIRYCENWNWYDGPGTAIPGVDIQGVACHEYGHALGLDHSGVNGATMEPAISGSGVGARSISADDIAGVQGVYGVADVTKPAITGVQLAAGQLTITGSQFSATGNEVWFTDASTTSSGNSSPIVKVTNVASTANGTQITVAVPFNAGPGHVAVRRNSTALSAVSNPWPIDPMGSSCVAQVTSYCTTTPNSAGPGALMGYAGSTSVTANDFTLVAVGLPANKNGIFYYGPNPISQPFGNGIRCVGGGLTGIFRFPVVVSDDFGDMFYTVDNTQAPASSGPGQIAGGTQWLFQCWYRDPAGGGAGFNLSDGLDVIFCP